MPKRSTVDALPRELKEWLDDELVKRGFGDYVALAIDLKAKGAAISKSSLHRYGSKFEERMAQLRASTEQARAIVAASPDDEGAMGEALVRLTQDKMFGILMDLEVDPKSIDLTKFSRSVADLTRSSIGQKRYVQEFRAKTAEKMKTIEAEAKAMKGETRDVALEMLNKVRAVYEGAL
jgi:hypothetical protein